MIVTCVMVHVKQENIEDFIKASTANHEGSIQEPGNLRFDLLQTKDNPAKFVFYEAYKSEEDVAAHKETPHYKKWREAVADWMATPRIGIPCTVIAPLDLDLWK